MSVSDACSLPRSAVNVWTSASIVSNENTAASSAVARLAKMCSAARRASAVRCAIRMLPLTSMSTASFTGPFTSARKSTMSRGWPASTIWKSFFDEIGDEPSLAIANDRRHRNEIDRRAESRRRLLFLRLCLRLHSWRSQGEHRSDDAHEHRLPPRHAGTYTQRLCQIFKLLGIKNLYGSVAIGGDTEGVDQGIFRVRVTPLRRPALSELHSVTENPSLEIHGISLSR